MPVSHTNNIIEIKDVSFWHGREQVLKDISFDIHKGDYLGIVGPNGAGKTTLLKIILGILKPSQGSVKLFGQDIATFQDWHKIGYVPQKHTKSEGFPATVYEVVSMGRFAQKGLFKYLNKTDRDIIMESLSHVDMAQHKDRLISELSGGQQQRVFIARALASQPEIIFLDEPTTHVDTKSQNDFYHLLKTLNQKNNITLVLVSHDVERITKEAMHIACVDCTLVCHATPEEFIKESKSLNLFGHEVKIIAHHHDV